MFCDATSVILVLSSKNVFDAYDESERVENGHHSLGAGLEVVAKDMPINLLYLFAVSVSIGLVLGLIGSYVLKKVTALTENAIA